MQNKTHTDRPADVEAQTHTHNRMHGAAASQTRTHTGMPAAASQTHTHTDPSAFANPNLGDPLDIADFTNMIGFANQSAAMEFLLSVKSGVKDMAFALTEASTPEVREWLKKQLFAGLNMHEKVYQLMVDRAWLHPYDPIEQSRVDLTAAEMTGNIARMPLFKDRTKVLETFDTPN